MKTKTIFPIFCVLILLVTMAGAMATTYTHKVVSYTPTTMADWYFFGSYPISIAYGSGFAAINSSYTFARNGSGWQNKYNWTTRYPITLSWQQKASSWQVGNTVIAFKIGTTPNNIELAQSNGYCYVSMESNVQNQPPIYYWNNYVYDNPNYVKPAYDFSTSFPGNWDNFSMILTPNPDNITKPNIRWYRNGVLKANVTMTSGICDNQDALYVAFGMSNTQPQTTYIANISIDGYAVDINETQYCTDTDLGTYPTVNYLLQGTVSSSNNPNYTDFCNSNTSLIEYSCSNLTSNNVVSTNYDCSAINKSCNEGACKIVSSCTQTAAQGYTYPTLWVENFDYIDSITYHGWTGYPFVVGFNQYGVCNVLFMDKNLSNNSIKYTFNSTWLEDTTFQWDMLPEASTPNSTYIPNGLPVEVKFASASDVDAIRIEFGADGVIYNALISGGGPIGNWQGDGIFSYKIITHQTNKTFDFYYTNSSNNFEYVVGCANCEYRVNTTIKKLVIAPQPEYPANYTALGVWLDNMVLSQGGAALPTDLTNFCYFPGCLFHDHFNYTDDTFAHGWYMYNTTPTQSYVVLANNSQGYYFDHYFSTFKNTDSGGVLSIQFRAMFPSPSPTAVDTIHFNLWSPDLITRPVDLQFKNGVIYGGGAGSLGSYTYNSWNTYTLLVNLNDNYFDLYQDNNRLVGGQPITNIVTSVAKLGFWVNTNSTILIDYVTASNGTILVDTIDTGIISDTGVPLSHLKRCWLANGSFDWSCCTASENADKDFWCPTRLTSLNLLGNITNFALTYFIYTIIIIIMVVIAVPFIIKLGGGG